MKPSASLDSLFAALTAADVHQWIRQLRPDDLTLEFKTAPRCLEHADERKMLARAIAGLPTPTAGQPFGAFPPSQTPRVLTGLRLLNRR